MKKIFAFIAAAVMTAGLLGGCSGAAYTDGTAVNIAMLKGPTGIGAVELMEKSESGETEGSYNITVAAAADDVTAKILSGEIDIAAVPTNLASVLYNKTEGGVTALAVNTLGVLYVLENGDTVHSVADLSGKTIYSSGQGAIPEYVLNYILEKNGVTDANVEYMGEHAEVAAAIAGGTADIVLLPEPNVTAATMKNEGTRIALDLTEEWNKISGNHMAMGCLIVRNEFLKEHRDSVDTFLKEYAESIGYVNSNISKAAELVEKYGIMASAKAAETAIPNCNIVYIDGNEMKDMLTGFFGVLFEAEPKAVGGKLPENDFYYVNK